MRYLIIGLGIYGSNLSRYLTDMGHEVIGVDKSQANIDAIKDYISTVYQIDVTEEASLQMLPLSNVDLVIVAIGEDFGASIKLVAMLKKMRIKHIYARAIDRLHESILEGFELERILTPEQRAARDLTFEMGLGTQALSMTIDEDNYIIKFKAPKHFIGLKYADLDFEKSYSLKLIAVCRQTPKSNALGITRMSLVMTDLSDPSLAVENGDEITCLGSKKSFFNLFHTLQS